MVRKFTWRRALQWVARHQEFFLLHALLVLKMLAFQSAIGFVGGTFGVLLSSLALLFLLTGWTLLLSVRKRVWTLIFVDLLLTFVLFSDALFFQNYDRILALPIVGQAGQLGDVMSVLQEQVSGREGLLLADFLFAVPYAIWRGRKATRTPALVRPRKQRLLQAAAVSLLSLSVLLGSLSSLVYAYGKHTVSDIYANNTVLENMGVFNYHLADAYKTLFQGDVTVAQSELEVLQAWMAHHRKEQPASPRLNGIAKGKNVILVQMEALQGFLIGKSVGGQEITPNLNKLAGESLYFDNYFPQIGLGVTSDCEFASLNSLYPLQQGSAYMLQTDNTFRSLPNLLAEQGYQTFAVHGYKPEFYNRQEVYPREGIQAFYNMNNLEMDEVVGWGLSDESMYRQSVEKMQEAQEPFFAYMISLSGHTTYNIPEEKQELTIPEGQYSELFSNYLQAQHYADKALGTLLDRLKREGLLDNSLLMLYGDHFGNSLQDGVQVSKFLGQEITNNRELMELRKIPFLIRLPYGEHAAVESIQAGQIDVLPTVANLLGLDREKMVFFGHDLLNAPPNSGFTAFRHYIGIGTYATDELFYVVTEQNQGHFEKGNCYSRTSGEELPLQACKAGYDRALREFSMSDRIVEGNAVMQLLGK
ncbi:MAG TPA: LTA synthase family protein [Bacilli bacterium]|nr:LTA synthase family protein [Bacilli bacterium]